MTVLYGDQFDSPCGEISIVFDELDRLYHLDFPDQGDRQQKLLTKRFGTVELKQARSDVIRFAFEAYFVGEYDALRKISCVQGGTDFQRQVWDKLCEIPTGATWSYRQLAIEIGNEKAVRAVARANALNPLSIIYPCHRVIGSDGSLTGYAGGLSRKEWLLQHEGAILAAL